ncbi:MAG: hypothetical protein NVS2B11_03120 [Acetobacteraceae bacterium]
MAVQLGQTPQGVAVGPPVPSGPMQFSARAMMRAVVVLPTPRTPVSIQAWARRPWAKALRRMRTIASWPISCSKVAGRYLRASTRYGAAGSAWATGAAAGAGSPNRPGPSGGGSGRMSSSNPDIVGAGPPGGLRGGRPNERPERELVAAASFRT